MLLVSEQKNERGKPAFLALGATRSGSTLRFERLWVETRRRKGKARATLAGERLLVDWPGLKPGLYLPHTLDILED